MIEMELLDTNSSLDNLSESNLAEETNTVIETNSSEDTVSGPDSVSEVSEWREIWGEVLSSRKRFTWGGCLPPLLLGFLPSVWDIASDIQYAANWDQGFCITNTSDIRLNCRMNQSLTYMTISFPVILFAITTLLNWITEAIDRNGSRLGVPRRCLSIIDNILGFFGFVLIIPGMTAIRYFGGRENPWIFPYMSYTCAGLMLVGKLLPVLSHGPQVRRLGVRLTALEATLEAMFQLWLVAIGMFGYNHTIDWKTYSSTVSSLVTISKAGIENLLVHGDEDKTEVPLLQKLARILKLLPVFVLTTVFRLVGLTAVFGVAAFWVADATWRISLFLAVVFGPFVILFMLKCTAKIRDISLSEMLLSALGEVGCITVWGRGGRDKCRGIQLFCFLFYLALYTLAIVFNLLHDVIRSNSDIYQPLLVTGLVCGALSLPLFLYQVFYMEKYHILTKLRNLSSVM